MSKLTWDPKVYREVVGAERTFNLYVERQYFAIDRQGNPVSKFDKRLGSLTFEPIPTVFDRLQEDSPWDNSENSM